MPTRVKWETDYIVDEKRKCVYRPTALGSVIRLLVLLLIVLYIHDYRNVLHMIVILSLIH